MIRTVSCLLLLAITWPALADEVARPVVSDIGSLLETARAKGEAHGILGGAAAEQLHKIGVDQPILVDVTTLATLATEGMPPSQGGDLTEECPDARMEGSAGPDFQVRDELLSRRQAAPFRKRCQDIAMKHLFMTALLFLGISQHAVWAQSEPTQPEAESRQLVDGIDLGRPGSHLSVVSARSSTTQITRPRKETRAEVAARSSFHQDRRGTHLEFGRALLRGLGLLRPGLADTLAALAELPGLPPLPPFDVPGSDDKRSLLFAAIDALSAAVASVPASIALPAGPAGRSPCRPRQCRRCAPPAWASARPRR